MTLHRRSSPQNTTSPLFFFKRDTVDCCAIIYNAKSLALAMSSSATRNYRASSQIFQDDNSAADSVPGVDTEFWLTD